MNLKERTDKVRLVRKQLTAFFDHMVSFYGGDDVIEEVMQLRGYHSQQMRDMLKRVGIYKAGDYSDFIILNKHYTDELLQDFGLIDDNRNYYMSGRYVLPIRDITGQVMALVGWDKFAGMRKYLTTTTYGYNRDISFFNYDIALREAWMYRNGKVIEVEGIFDALALTSVGFPAFANTGLEMSSIKEIMMSRFRGSLVFTDNDSGGRKAIPYLYTSEVGVSNYTLRRKDSTVWKPKTETTYVVLPEGVKDPDEYVRDYIMEEDLAEAYDKKFIHFLT